MFLLDVVENFNIKKPRINKIFSSVGVTFGAKSDHRYYRWNFQVFQGLVASRLYLSTEKIVIQKFILSKVLQLWRRKDFCIDESKFKNSVYYQLRLIFSI